MTTEELMKPRYKVIADYPKCHYNVGDIIEPIGGDNWDCYANPTLGGLTNPDKYRHLFEPLPWWKERKVEEMPEYVKCLSPNFKWSKGYIIKVDRWLKSFGPTLRFYSPDTDKITHHPCSFVPATEAEYNTYLQTTNQNNG